MSLCNYEILSEGSLIIKENEIGNVKDNRHILTLITSIISVRSEWCIWRVVLEQVGMSDDPKSCTAYIRISLHISCTQIYIRHPTGGTKIRIN